MRFRLMDNIANIDDRIVKLKKKKIRIQTQKAIIFMKEAEKIFKDAFSPDIALAVLSDWNTASKTKKKEWTTRSHSFRTVSVQSAPRKAAAIDPTAIPAVRKN